MEVNYLLKDELKFELACRGVYDLEKVAPMRKVLREILNREASGESSITLKVPSSCIDDPVSELTSCETKFKALSVGLSEITDGTDSSNLRRIFSRLSHLLGRVKLIIPTGQAHIEKHLSILKEIQDAIASLETVDNVEEEDEEEVSDQLRETLHKSLGAEASSILDKLEQGSSSGKGKVVKTVSETNRNLPAVLEQGKREDSKKSALQPSGTDFSPPRLHRTSTIDVDIPNRKLVPIKDWGIKFNGKGTLSINGFLERIEELKDARNATEDDLYRYAIDLFEDDALIWYRANRDCVSCWDELVSLLIRSFQKPYYEEELLDEIKKRTQGRHESVLIYISVMQNMFRRLPTKLSDRQKLNILLRNIQPDFQRAVCRDHFDTVSELLEVLRMIEQTKINCENFQEPGQSRALIEPDLAYQGHQVNAIASHQSTQGGRAASSRKCWNCRVAGHIFRDCPSEKQRLFCYKCGRFGSTVKKCPCSFSGNANSGDRPAEGLPK